MKNILKKDELVSLVRKLKNDNKSIGFVPTMGFLHEGHLSLMKEARKDNDILITSVFVNPTQFGEGEDLESYPRNEAKDTELMESVGVDYAFFPDVDEMYPSGYNTYVEVFGNITKKLCGASREGHFRGVTTIVAKLFNLVRPDRAYFGLKDAQQVAVINKMVIDLDFDIEIVACPIMREDDGLAMSSRNVYLTKEERIDALVLNKSLQLAKELIEAGERSAEIIKSRIIDKINSVEYAVIDYIEVVDAVTLEDITDIKGEILIALAVKVGKPRLIDNIRMTVN